MLKIMYCLQLQLYIGSLPNYVSSVPTCLYILRAYVYVPTYLLAFVLLWFTYLIATVSYFLPPKVKTCFNYVCMLRKLRP